jgi:hypothetical protein
MSSPRMSDRRTEPIFRVSSGFFPGLAHADFDEVWAWADAAVSSTNDRAIPVPVRPAILDRLERYGVSGARLFAAIMWLRTSDPAQRLGSSSASRRPRLDQG